MTLTAIFKHYVEKFEQIGTSFDDVLINQVHDIMSTWASIYESFKVLPRSILTLFYFFTIHSDLSSLKCVIRWEDSQDNALPQILPSSQPFVIPGKKKLECHQEVQRNKKSMVQIKKERRCKLLFYLSIISYLLNIIQ